MLTNILRSRFLRFCALVFLVVLVFRAVKSTRAAVSGHVSGGSNAVKVSVLDHGVDVPSVVVTQDGTVHVIYREEQTSPPYAPFLYYRSSHDGGKSWSPAKSLSEILPNTPVGTTKILADSSGRIYAIWRTTFNIVLDGPTPSSQGDNYNLVYRVLDNGSWSEAVYIHPPTTQAAQYFGSASWSTAIDPSTGKPVVIWNTNPAPRHPEAYVWGMIAPGIRLGSVMKVVLDGAHATPPQEIFHTPIAARNNPKDPACEGLDLMNGYVDKTGQPHILAQALPAGVTPYPTDHFDLIQNNAMTVALELPGTDYQYWHYPPTLLVDEQGRQHVITMYQFGETQSVRDYMLGSNVEPVIVRAAKANTGQVLGVQAFQGPGGRMAAVIQMADVNPLQNAETYLVVNDGNHWSTPISVTNNAARAEFNNTATSARSSVSTASSWYPDKGAAAFGPDGHVYLAYIVNRKDLFQQNAFGVTLAGGSSGVPQLMFARY